ncbi:MAG: prepilin-type N-terminal cleavage/methylation domain-containing protein [Candidatus Pacebacteria bacterium]|nr:prepilin-type N-terminal cleavage/methylation domain-containing protein [Candidatus Paceibacterota bacterium]
MLNFKKQQHGFALIGMLIAIAIIAILFIYSNNTFFSKENDIKENKAIYEEAKKDLDEIEQKHQQLNDLGKTIINNSEDIKQIYDEKKEIINEK